MKKYVLVICIVLCSVLPTLTQDDPVENFGRILISFEIVIDDNDFDSVVAFAAPSDLSRFYIAGNNGQVYIFDDKGDPQGILESEIDGGIDDMVVDVDNQLYIAHSGAIAFFDAEGEFIREIPGSLTTQYYSRLATLDDGTFYATTFFGGDTLFHIGFDGRAVTPPHEEFFENMTGDSPGIFDHFMVGEDGFLYYYHQSEGSFYQFDEFGEVRNRYVELIEQFTLRDAMVVDEDGQILVGGSNGVEIYGEKESLVNQLAVDGRGFAQDMMFADNGQLVVLQSDRVTVLQYGARDADDETEQD